MTQKNIQIESAAAEAIKVIADAASAATKLIATQAAEAVKVANAKDGNDHDLIIKLDTKMDGLSEQIKHLENGTSMRISNLEKGKVDIKDSYPEVYKEGVDNSLANHEIRLVKLETAITRVTALLSIGSAIVSILVGLLVWHVLGK